MIKKIPPFFNPHVPVPVQCTAHMYTGVQRIKSYTTSNQNTTDVQL